MLWINRKCRFSLFTHDDNAMSSADCVIEYLVARSSMDGALGIAAVAVERSLVSRCVKKYKCCQPKSILVISRSISIKLK